MELVCLAEHRPFEFQWWSGTNERYDVCFHYKIADPPTDLHGGEILLAVGWRGAFGSNRRRVLVFRGKQNVLVEFVGTDSWREDQTLAWLLKVPGGRRDIAAESDIPPEYREFTLGRFSDWVSGPWTRNGFAIRVGEADHEALIRVALIREQHNFRSAAPPTSQPEDDQPIENARVSCAADFIASPDVVRELASYARQYVDDSLFPAIRRCTGIQVETREDARRAIATPVASLALLLGNYAFARQGAERAGYREACTTVLTPYLGRDTAFWNDFPTWDTFHDAFVTECQRRRIRQNEKFNPGLIRDVFAMALRSQNRGLFDAWADKARVTGGVAAVFREICAVHGIGNKIGAFICRDTVFFAGIEDAIAPAQRRYLQPVDIWVGRAAEYLNPTLTFGKDPWYVIADYLAHAASAAGVSGISLNQGSWYFGSHVAASASRFIELLDDLDAARRTRRSNRLIVIACGKRKIWDDERGAAECPAKNAYTGPFFKVNRRYAERFAANDWMILSARFGFLRPDTMITNYNATFSGQSADTIGADQLRVSARQAGVTEYNEMEVLGGSEYVERLREALAGYPAKILTPYADCGGIGDMMGKATRAISGGGPMDSCVIPSVPSSSAATSRADSTGAGNATTTTADVRRVGRSGSTSDSSFIRRAFELHLQQRMSQGQAVKMAAEEFGVVLPKSYREHPGVQFHRWRSQGYGA